jgi:hypothetical protein
MADAAIAATNRQNTTTSETIERFFRKKGMGPPGQLLRLASSIHFESITAVEII